MTKEELYKMIEIKSSHSWYYKELLNEFFESNLCIPKGKNRHPYADVYHAGVEGTPWQWSEDGVNWYDVTLLKYQYRIKPQESVYEYKYSIVLAGKKYISEEYKTIEELKDFNNTYSPVAIEETKKVRQ